MPRRSFTHRAKTDLQIKTEISRNFPESLTRTCDHCSKRFVPASNGRAGLYCATKCRVAAYRLRQTLPLLAAMKPQR